MPRRSYLLHFDGIATEWGDNSEIELHGRMS